MCVNLRTSILALKDERRSNANSALTPKKLSTVGWLRAELLGNLKSTSMLLQGSALATQKLLPFSRTFDPRRALATMTRPSNCTWKVRTKVATKLT